MSLVDFEAGIDGSLVVTGCRKRCVSLRFRPEDVEVSYPGVEPISLPWSACFKVRSVMDGVPPADGWAITSWAASRSGREFGVAVKVSGNLERASREVLAATVGMWRRFESAFSSTLHGRAFPLINSSTWLTAADAERATLITLTRVLVDQPERRALLVDRDRMGRLAADLRTRLQRDAVERIGATRDRFDVVGALHACDFIWKYGRPLGRTEVPDLDRVVDLIMKRLETSPYREGRRPISKDEIVRTIRRNYVDIEPWPFDALIA